MKQLRWLPWLLGVVVVLVIARLLGLDNTSGQDLVVEPVRRTSPQAPAARPEAVPRDEPSARPDSTLPLEQAARESSVVASRGAFAPLSQGSGADDERFDGRAGVALFGMPPPPPVAVKAPPPPAPAPTPPPVVEAPAPPRPGFSVMGVYRARGEAVSLWINLGGQLILAQTGDLIDNHWRIEAIERQRVRLLHASLGIPAELPIPAEVAR